MKRAAGIFLWSILLGMNSFLHAEETTDARPARRASDSALESDGKTTEEGEKTDPEEPPPLPPGVTLRDPKFTLGVFRPTPTVPEGTVQLQLASSVTSNSNLSDTSAGVVANSRTLFFNSATLRAIPELIEKTHTRLAADISGGFARYDEGTEYDYNLLNTNLGILQEFTDIVAVELGWRYSQFYGIGSLVNDLTDHGVRLSLRREDALPADFFLSSGYEFQANFSRPKDRTRLAHFLRLGLGYNITDDFQALVGYRLLNEDFTDSSVNDSATRHEFRGQLSYRFWEDFYVAGSVSYLFGETIGILDPTLEETNLNNLSFGFQLGANLPLLN